MSRLTRSSIEKEILKKTGIDCRMFKGNGYFYFVSLGKAPTLLDFAQETSVYVSTIGNMDVAGWVYVFEGLIKDAELPDGSVVDADGVLRL